MARSGRGVVAAMYEDMRGTIVAWDISRGGAGVASGARLALGLEGCAVFSGAAG